MAAVLLPLLVFGMKHPPHAQAETVKKSYDWRGFWNVMKQSRLIHILYFGVFTCGFTMGIIDAHLVPILKDAHVSHVNGMMAAFGAFIIIGGLLAGWLSDLLGEQKRHAIHLIFHSVSSASFACSFPFSEFITATFGTSGLSCYSGSVTQA
nr:MFS transporter [Bacillus subtilis]